MTFIPKFTLDLTTASTRAFNELLENFEIWRRNQETLPLDLANGWRIVTQEDAEGMLLRNPVGANRRPTLSTVKYYAKQMAKGDWKKTGQPVIFDSSGVLLDAGHRLWAAYLSGSSFPTYVIGDVPPDPTVFAYIDNGKARNAADALATAGLNGLSKTLAQVVNIAMHYEQGRYTASTKKSLDKVTPIEVVHYVQENENLRLAARLMAGEYKAAREILFHKDIASFLAFRIVDLHGESVLDGFMTELGIVPEEPQEGSPIAALQKVMADDERAAEPMAKHQVLGHAIKAFNAWVTGEQVRKLTLRVNEAFPRFVQPQPVQQAAE